MDTQVVAIAQDILVLKVGFNRQFTRALHTNDLLVHVRSVPVIGIKK